MEHVQTNPAEHPDWMQPHSGAWYAHMAQETGGYAYPWQSVYEEPRAEQVFADRILACVNESSAVLDVGCGHGDFTSRFAAPHRTVVGIDVHEGFVASAQKQVGGSVSFLTANADQVLPFSDRSFDVIYTKKGPWLFRPGQSEGYRVLKPGGWVLGLYHAGTDGGLRMLFPGLFAPFPDRFQEDLLAAAERQLAESGLEPVEVRMVEEVEYLARPEDVLIKKCFGQKMTVKQQAWRDWLGEVETVFRKHAAAQGLKVVNYHTLLVGKARSEGS